MHRIAVGTQDHRQVLHTILAYGNSLNASARTAADYVNDILNGARPADLPVEEPTVYDLFVNQTTAQALGSRFRLRLPSK